MILTSSLVRYTNGVINDFNKLLIDKESAKGKGVNIENVDKSLKDAIAAINISKEVNSLPGDNEAKHLVCVAAKEAVNKAKFELLKAQSNSLKPIKK